MRHLFRAALLLCLLMLVGPQAFAGPKKSKPLPSPRIGDVLIAGGIASDGNTTNSAEFYSVAKKKFLATNPMSTARAGHQMNWFPACDERTVNSAVALGGFSGSATITGTSISYNMNVLDNADVYTLATGTFALDPASEGATMVNGRALFASLAFPGNLATDFLQGHVLMIGGVCNAPDLESCRTANILHPDDDKINGTSNPKVPIMMETLTLLADGTALMTGGIDNFSGTITN